MSKEQAAKKQLTDGELEQAVGGREQYEDSRYVYTCELVVGYTSFILHLFHSGIKCAYYEWNKTASNSGLCFGCTHLKIDEKPL